MIEVDVHQTVRKLAELGLVADEAQHGGAVVEG